jgi:hypothetical protein
MTLIEWALKHRISPEAIRDLCQSAIFQPQDVDPEEDKRLEAPIQRDVRLASARAGKMLFRNNRGAGRMESGNHVRYGLANDSKKFGDAWKSGDLIGWESIVITPEWVGHTIARFLSVEIKRGDWKFSGTKEELAQAKWAALVNLSGGRAVITNKPEAV